MAPRRTGLHHRSEELAAALPPLMVAANRVAATVSQGVHGRRRVGQGETFWQFRRYQWGDAAENIDWRQSARSVPVYVRETEWEAAQSVWLWRDASASMAYRSDSQLPTKAERADLLLMALISLLIRGGEQVALLGSGKTPATGRAVLSRIARTVEEDRLAEVEGAEKGLPVFEPLPRYGRLVLFGDFLAPLEDVREAIEGHANRGVRGHMIQVLDPAEETLPFRGRVRFEGPEDEGSVLFGRTETVRDDYRQALANHRRGLRALARSAGWSMAVHHTDQPPQMALLTLYLALSETLHGT
jgi:uncharacterized protein (DUF58 family)